MKLLFVILLLLGLDVDFPSKLISSTENSTFKAITVLDYDTKVFDVALNPEKDSDTISYTNTKAGIDRLRKRLVAGYRSGRIPLDSIRSEFTTQLVDAIVPHWYGTPWSFGGHTPVPNQGKIACGYFVSTTLRDMGIKLDRYKLAQKSPIDEAKVISCGSEITSIVRDSPEKAFEEIDALTQEGLHFIGFDIGHVGYLLKNRGELLLIHSNYLSSVAVCIEPLKESRVFQSYSRFHLVDITHNDPLIQLWLNSGTL